MIRIKQCLEGQNRGLNGGILSRCEFLVKRDPIRRLFVQMESTAGLEEKIPSI